MEFFKKQRYNLIAAVISIAFHILLIVLLSLKLKEISQSVNSNQDKEEFSIQLQEETVKDIPPPPSPKINAEVVKKITEALAKEIPAEESAEKPEEMQNTSQDLGEIPLGEKEDSLYSSALKQLLEAIQTPTLEDSIDTTDVKESKKPSLQQIVTERRRQYDEDRKFMADNYRIIRNFKKVYPYAARTRQIIEELDRQLALIPDEKTRRQLIKKTEKELFGKFEKDVRNMSFSQGKLLLKLIARETDQSAYSLIKTYKGTLPATFWYGVGLLFHENLKMKYDSLGEDALLEKIVLKYKQGKLK